MQTSGFFFYLLLSVTHLQTNPSIFFSEKKAHISISFPYQHTGPYPVNSDFSSAQFHYLLFNSFIFLLSLFYYSSSCFYSMPSRDRASVTSLGSLFCALLPSSTSNLNLFYFSLKQFLLVLPLSTHHKN